MEYRNKTFVSFASEDIRSYRLMRAWKANNHIDFNFHDAHDLNTARDSSLDSTIRRRLRERLNETKQVVMLIGDQTRTIAADQRRFLFYEAETIAAIGLPVVFANLNGSRLVQQGKLPTVLTDRYSISVSFQPAIIRYALDHFVDDYAANSRTKSTPHYYKAHVYESLGL